MVNPAPHTKFRTLPKPVIPKPQRCAIYTRKSTEHNLDLAFNSLDAQREACEAYIKSQAHEGWTLIAASRFDDGGLSGASLERPALQTLLDQVRAKKIDIIVVYKVDRLTRSLADFAKLVELFDEHDVSFVSVTQSFNTTSSMGRLTLNVLALLRPVRAGGDRRAGARQDRRLQAQGDLGWRTNPARLSQRRQEAGDRSGGRRAGPQDFRGLFAARVRSASWPPRSSEKASGRDQGMLAMEPTIAAERFMVGPLAHLLKNRFYIGEVVYRGEVHKGEHEPILDRELFDAVQAKLAERAVARKLRRSRSPALLMGLIFDDRGNPMSPSHANKKGVRYRYYVSHAILQNQKIQGRVGLARIRTRIETIIVEALRQAIADRQHYKDDQFDSCNRIAGQRPRPDRASRRSHRSSPARSRNHLERRARRPRRCVTNCARRRTAIDQHPLVATSRTASKGRHPSACGARS